jgi:hypothetical protein
MLIAVTNHAAERYRQRIRGTLDEKAEIQAAVARAWRDGRVETGPRGELFVRDRGRRRFVYVCRRDGQELIVLTLWEEGDDSAVPRRFTDALRRDAT